MIAAAALAALLGAAPAEAAEVPIVSSTASAAAAGARIRAVRFERVNVFDPRVRGEDNWLFRTANRIHIPTREALIRRELLFAPGDAWDPLTVLQSERNLRANGSFRWAEIAPERRPDGAVEAVVRTQDSWTTNPRIAFGTEGGEQFFGFGIEEGNLLGRGKSVLLDHSKKGPRRTNTAAYGDPRFFGSRLRLDGSYSLTDRGDSGAASLTRPFFALESDSAMSVSWRRTVGEGILFRDGEEHSKYDFRRRISEASIGARLGEERRTFVQRAELGWYSDLATFSSNTHTRPGLVPRDRELNGPTVGYSWVKADFVKETYLDRMERVEDFNLGNEFSVRAGWMPKATASDRDRAMFHGSIQQGLRLTPRRFLIARVGARGRTAGGVWENGLFTADLNGFWKTETEIPQTWVFHAEYTLGRYLDRENQVVLGGDTGLRGYKNNAFVGERAILLNLEDRAFLDREFFHLVRLGGAVFFDAGAVVPAGSDLSMRQVKFDLGFGLRAASTRSRSGAVGRIDLAYALNGGPGGSRWVLSVRAGQAFSLFNSAAQRVDAAPSSRLN
jgi:hypothetical protein